MSLSLSHAALKAMFHPGDSALASPRDLAALEAASAIELILLVDRPAASIKDEAYASASASVARARAAARGGEAGSLALSGPYLKMKENGSAAVDFFLFLANANTNKAV